MSSNQKHYFNITNHLHHYQRPQSNWVAYWKSENGRVRNFHMTGRKTGDETNTEKKDSENRERGSRVKTQQILLILGELLDTGKTFH